MSKSDTYENELLKLVFNNVAMTLVGDAAGLLPSAAAGSLYVAFHSADPGEGGNQATSEVAYTGYARAAVARTSGGWTVTGNSVSPTANVNTGACTAGATTATHFSVGTSASGAGKVLYKGALTPAISISAGVTPELTTGTTITED